MICICFSLISAVGWWRLKLWLSPTACNFFMYQVSIVTRLKGLIAPSAIVSRPLGITSSGSTSSREPRPVHTGQAPCGLLKLKVRGTSSGIVTSGWSWQAYINEYDDSSSLSALRTLILPSATSSACSTDWAKRVRLASSLTKRSITISILCL